MGRPCVLLLGPTFLLPPIKHQPFAPLSCTQHQYTGNDLETRRTANAYECALACQSRAGERGGGGVGRWGGGLIKTSTEFGGVWDWGMT